MRFGRDRLACTPLNQDAKGLMIKFSLAGMKDCFITDYINNAGTNAVRPYTKQRLIASKFDKKNFSSKNYH